MRTTPRRRTSLKNAIIEVAFPKTNVLVPSTRLFPATNIFPNMHKANDLEMSLYKELMYKNFVVADYGKIQIRLDGMENKESSIVRTYEGDATKKNTYIIDDNVFLCNGGIKYDSYLVNGTFVNPFPEIDAILENLWDRIRSVRYVPFEAVASGMPWLECLDRITIITEEQNIDTLILRRKLSGIQHLEDAIEGDGVEETEEIQTYGLIMFLFIHLFLLRVLEIRLIL